MDTSNIFIKTETIMRLLKDVKQLIKHPLTDNGIYYRHDEEDMLKGYAMIVGPEGTPYFGGFYFFEFFFGVDYPFSPPHVKFMTNNKLTRFNPNLYTCGKVCISILNTWQGEKWSSCQTISSVLLTLCSILNESPLENEPGFDKYSIDYIPYQKSIEYMNIKFSICEIITMINKKDLCLTKFEQFYPIMKENFVKNYDKLMAFIQSNNKETHRYIVYVYNMITDVNYETLENMLIETNKLIMEETI